jgi:RNA polymerase sigma-70 factor (ECF subfamily)
MTQARTSLRVVPPTPPASQAPDPESAFRQYSGYVAAVATRLLGRDDEVDDVVQEVFLVALSGLARLREPDAVKGWLGTLTVRTSIRRLRRRRVRSFFGLDEGSRYASLVSPNASPEQHALLSRIYSLLDDLPVNQRVAWTLRYVESHSLDEIGRLCNCSLATAKRRIAAAHETLGKAVRDG